jgi:CBS domain-containing protein/anti-sigma regulatory factor (Ser/Thr protein kinase)
MVEKKPTQEITKLQGLAYELTVGQAMSPEVITVSPHDTMAQFREVLRTNRISGTPVMENGEMIGVVSIKDLIEALAAGELDATVGEKMFRRVETLYADEPLVCAVDKFARFKFGRFPVVDREEHLVGIITQGDVTHTLLRRLEVDYREEEIHRYRASHIFEDIVANETALVFGYRIIGRDFDRAGEASGNLKTTLSRLGFAPRVIRRVAVATYEAEMNIVIYTDGGEIVAEVRPDLIRIEALDNGPGIPDIDLAMQPGYSTASDWIREMGFGAGMGLPNIKSCSDQMRLESTVGVGTRLEIVIHVDEKREHERRGK